MIQCPYNKLEVTLALNLITEEQVASLEKFVEDGNLNNKKEFNKTVAESNGISVEALVGSPNYNHLCTEYYLVKLEEFGFTSKQAWGLFMSMAGND